MQKKLTQSNQRISDTEISANNFLGLTGIILAGITFFGTVLFPLIPIKDGWPRLDISDVTCVLLSILTIFFFRDRFYKLFQKYKLGVLLFATFIAFVILSIALNDRLSVLRDWFEVIKYFKIILFFLFFNLFFDRKKQLFMLKLVLFLLLIFNLLHYYDVFGFNQSIEIFYAPPHHLDFFGLNSAGEPSTKRALGTMGNPNVNGALFFFFLILFLPKNESQWFKQNTLWVFLAFVGIVISQSRTVFAITIFGILVYLICMRFSWKVWVSLMLLLGISLLLFNISSLSYLGSLAQPKLMQSSGLGRVAQWKIIFNEMTGVTDWIYGNGPRKEFFRSKNIFAESEYVLLIFRYGIIGLLLFYTAIITLFKNNFTKKNLFFLFGILAIGITNTPFHDLKLLVIIPFFINFLLNEKEEI